MPRLLKKRTIKQFVWALEPVVWMRSGCENEERPAQATCINSFVQWFLG